MTNGMKKIFRPKTRLKLYLKINLIAHLENPVDGLKN